MPFSSFKLRCVSRQEVDQETSFWHVNWHGSDTGEVCETGKGLHLWPYNTYNQQMHCDIEFSQTMEDSRNFSDPKVNEPRCDADHRSVSILPTLSKVLERLVLHQRIEYINEEALLGPTISGFRKGHYTTSVL